MVNPLKAASDALARVARQSALFLAGALLLMVGMAFLTAAAWVILARHQDAFAASLIIGLFYLGLAGILFALGAAAGRRPKPHPSKEEFRRAAERGDLDPPTRGEFPPMVEAFVFGLNTALRLRRRRPPRKGAPPEL